MSAERAMHTGAPSRQGRITATFARLQAQGRKALIPYVTAGFPWADSTVSLMHAMVNAGADIIELGVPFSDPSADGPVIQKAGDRALANGVGMAQVLAVVQEFRLQDQTTPVVLIGYSNPLERYNQLRPRTDGKSAFVTDAARCGVDGVLVVDYPPAACVELALELRQHAMDMIFLLAPTSTDARMAEIAAVASGYVYYVSLKGVTGAGTLDLESVQNMLPRIRKHVQVPVGVGFGIRDAETARSIGKVADAIVIGSKLIQLIDAAPPEQINRQAAAFVQTIRSALDS